MLLGARRFAMRKKFIARLSEEERDELRTVIRETVIRQLKGTGQKVRRAQILLKADAERRRMPREGGCREKADAERRRMPREGGCREKADAEGPNWTDGRIAEAFSCQV